VTRALDELPPAVHAVFQALRDSAASLAGVDVDQEYAAAASKLRDRQEFRRVYSIQDPGERRRIVMAWPRDKQTRWQLELERSKARRARR